MAFSSAWQTYGYFVSSGESPRLAHGSWSSEQPQGNPL
eukprot:CAMPEP_0119427628 /NCGR_PEP_ID=MMETSP1335-20130426/38757_1 /TAXON_ID=259385 /ORGANISM="Chrysoculter rhomboideus, Strain RCC1486" /LENGTH=37 /DNA_ID= /DNA_START= /DNA_END= /DNA_ORIENTATION=